MYINKIVKHIIYIYLNIYQQKSAVIKGFGFSPRQATHLGPAAGHQVPLQPLQRLFTEQVVSLAMSAQVPQVSFWKWPPHNYFEHRAAFLKILKICMYIYKYLMFMCK